MGRQKRIVPPPQRRVDGPLRPPGTIYASMLPELQAHWQRTLAHWTGTLRSLIGNETSTLHINGSTLLFDNPSPSSVYTPQAPQVNDLFPASIEVDYAD